MAENTVKSINYSLTSAKVTPVCAFFRSLPSLLNFNPSNKITVIPVVHCSKNSLPMIEALSHMFYVPILILKDSTKYANPHIVQTLQDMGFMIDLKVNKDFCKNEHQVIHFFEKYIPYDHKFIIMDHGGYFAPTIQHICKHFSSDKFIGVTEHTLNGHCKYETQLSIFNINRPIMSIAKAEAKSIVDADVAETIVHVIDHVIRQEKGNRLNNRNSYRIGIIGYGNLGMGIAKHLKERLVQNITICEQNPLKQIKAFSDGFILDGIHGLCQTCNIIISATGNKAIKSHHLKLMSNNTFIATVTSPDDELDLDKLIMDKALTLTEKRDVASSYYINSSGNKVHLIMNGLAPNLFMETCLGNPSLIYLVEGMQILSNFLLAQQVDHHNTVQLLSDQYQQKISQLWLNHFAELQPIDFNENLNVVPFNPKTEVVLQPSASHLISRYKKSQLMIS